VSGRKGGIGWRRIVWKGGVRGIVGRRMVVVAGGGAVDVVSVARGLLGRRHVVCPGRLKGSHQGSLYSPSRPTPSA